MLRRVKGSAGLDLGGESMGSELGVGRFYCCAGQLDSLEEQ